MEERSVGTEEQVMPWLFEAMDGLSMQGMKCEMTLFLPAPEDSPALGQPAVRAGEDIFPETWILVLKCAEENGKSITLRIPEYGGLKAPEEYGRLLEAAEILNSGSMKE